MIVCYIVLNSRLGGRSSLKHLIKQRSKGWVWKLIPYPILLMSNVCHVCGILVGQKIPSVFNLQTPMLQIFWTFNLEVSKGQSVKVGYISMFIFVHICDFGHCFVHCRETTYDLFYSIDCS
jgi:hypothetical protein